MLALLPELLDATVLPASFVIAHLPGAPAQLVGAAAFSPAIHHAFWPGYRCMARVLPPWRRQGVGQALMARLVDDARSWDLRYLHAWQESPADAESGRFLRGCGFRVAHTLHHFVGSARRALDLMQPLVDALHTRARIPAEFRLLPLNQVPLDAVLDLHRREFGGSATTARALFETSLQTAQVQGLSVALWDGQQLAGYLLAGTGSEAPHAASEGEETLAVHYWASDPRQRHGWAAAVLLQAFLQAVVAAGHDDVRFHCNDRTRATLNIARKIGSRRLSVRHGWAIDLDLDPGLRGS